MAARNQTLQPQQTTRLLLAPLCLICAALVLLLPKTALASSTQDDDANLIPATVSRGATIANHYHGAVADDGRYRVSTRFSSFDGEPLSLGFELPSNISEVSLHEFGISDAELKAVLHRCIASGPCEQAELDRQTTHYYQTHGLRLRTVPGRPSHLSVDVAQVVRRNRARVQPVATALRRLAETRGRDTQWMMDAAVALVQTGLVYRKPSLRENGRQILGFYPPPRALERGYGDCDTKAALLAAILQNLTDTPIIGIHVPKHYLLGIAGTPQPGQATLRYRGTRYVLVEASGPGKRPPGDIATRTQTALNDMSSVRIDPMF